MEEETWTIAKFTDNDSVEAVPTNWLHCNMCYWPMLPKNQLLSAIKNHEPPNTSWPSYEVSVFRYATYDNYGKAQAKARVVEDRSDLQTDTDGNTKRKRIETGVRSDEESLNDNTLLIIPKIETLTNSDNNISVDNHYSELSSLSDIEDNVKNNAAESGPTSSTCNDCKETKKSLKLITNQNHEMLTMISKVLSEVITIKNITKKEYNKTAVPKKSILSDFTTLKFPLNSEEDIHNFEHILSNQENFESGVNELVNIGGHNNYNFVKRLLSLLLSDDLAMKYSWLGRKGKSAFCNLTIAYLIICAVEKGKMAKSRKETETSIQVWLKRAPDRKKNISKNLR
ncbi:PREDICTED: uncharacterized protein LOC107185531 [Dufourea novaeangliae]|uniref:uncharacterized protein LOC107185531 n=1 Tax=Dufourea novaeangliae TaxID=178035 RepID=UPI0007670866|nr:PREDICTED: uncharacterized protein LOC107185531 [Dufourea novaeangliae]